MVKRADTFYCAGKTYTAEKNHLVFINPGEVHTGSTRADTSLQYYSLCPDKQAMQQVAETLEIAIPADFNFQHALLKQPLLEEKFIPLFRSFYGSPDDSLLQEELFFHCMYAMLHQTNNKNYPLSSTIQKDIRVQLLTAYIRTHFQQQISLQQLASLVNLNPFHLVRLFKKAVGVSPYYYLLIIRAEHARQLLRQGYQVQEAALEAGFYDASHFNRLFRKIAGLSPKSFRSSKCQYRTIFDG